MLFSHFIQENVVFEELVSWKRSFERLNEEQEAVLKKKQALSSLVSSGRISQSTFDIFDKEMNEALAEIEKQKKVLLDKMTAKTKEIDEQIKILERLLANFEIQHVGGEIEEEAYQQGIALLSTGLETARQELNAIKEVIGKLTGVPQVEESVAPQQIEIEKIEDINVGKPETEKQTLTETPSNPPETSLPEAKADGETTQS